MYHRYPTALSHLFLLGVGLYCFKSSGGLKQTPLLVVSYGIIVVHSVLGVLKWGNPLIGHRIDKLYSCSRVLQTLFAFSCIVGQIWLNGGYRKEFAYLHPALSLIPMLLYLSKKNKQKYIDVIIALNIASCIYTSFMAANWFGVATATSYTINHFILKDESEIFDMPSLDFYNYALCFFTYFSKRALQG